MNHDVVIRPVEKDDQSSIWQIIQAVIASGDTYVFSPDSSKDNMLAYWCGPDKHTFVALLDDQIVGTFFIKDNFPDLGAHVANAGFMTSPIEFGKGIGRTMGHHALEIAKDLGYLAMQFNFVVKSNHRAVKLWQSLGFQIIGEIPDAYQHRTHGLTDAFIMWRRL